MTATTTRTVRAALYQRVSSEEQIEGYSLDAQDRAGRLYCQTHGWEVAQVYRDEGRSARTDDLAKRPAFQQMLADAEAGLHRCGRRPQARPVRPQSPRRLRGVRAVGESSCRLRLAQRADGLLEPVWAADADDAGGPVPVLLGQSLARRPRRAKPSGKRKGSTTAWCPSG